MREGFVLKSKTKICKCCKKEKSIKDFYANGNYKDGHLNVCKQCHTEQIKKNKMAKKGMAVIKIVVPVEIKYEIDKRKIDLQRLLIDLISNQVLSKNG